MALDGELRFGTRVDTTGFKKGANTVKSQANQLKSTFASLGRTIGLAFGVVQLVQFGKQAIETASDLAEVQNVVDTAFKDMSYKMEDFAKTSIETFGMSELSAKQAGSTFMAMGSGMGIAADSASDMAIALTGLTGDMASFYNVSQDVAKTALSSVYTGETESLKKFGIVMTESNLEAYALTEGITKSYNAMSQAEKVQLRYAYVMSQTALAQGDFAKTSGSWANQTRVLSERWKTFLGILGKGLINVLTPVVKYLNVVMSQLIAFAETASSIITSVFGDASSSAKGTTSNISDMSDTTQDVVTDTEDIVTGMEDTADATKEATEEAEKGKFAFDELNTVQKEDTATVDLPEIDDSTATGTDATIPIGIDKTALENNLTEVVKNAKDSLNNFFEPIQNAWATYGATTIETFKMSLGSVWELIKSIGTSFAEVWTNGTGEITLGLILSIITNIFNIVGNLAESFTTAWNNAGLGTQIIQNIADVINILLGYVDLITASMATWVSTIDWTPLLLGIESVTSALKPFAENIGEGLLWFFNEVLAPIGSFVIEDVVPLFLEGLANAIDLVNTVVTTLQPLASWLWENFLQPLAEWTGGVIVSVLQSIVDGLKNVSDWISEHQKLVETITIIVGSFAAAWGLVNAAILIFNVIGAILAGVAGAIGAVMAFILSPIGLVVLAIGAIIAIIVLLAKNWDAIAETAQDVWDAIVKAWKDTGKWFKTNVIEPIEYFFSHLWVTVTKTAGEAWEGIKDAFKSIGDWFMENVIEPILDAFGKLWSGIKGIINGLISMVEGFINGVISGVNAIINALNSIHVDIPDWVPLLGGKSLGFSLPSVSKVSLPRLATGTVVPPTSGEFAAILGDNKRETEVVSPLSTMKQALKEALAESGNNSHSGNTTLNLQVDGKTFAQLILPYINGENGRKGVILVEGGI